MAISMHASVALALAILLTPVPVRAQAAPPAGFVDAADVVEGLVVDMRYFGADNFVGTRIDGYEAPRCILARRAAANRALLAAAMRRRGLVPYNKEWWHFSLADEPFPDRYFDFPVR